MFRNSSIARKLSDGQFRVYDRNGRNIGTYMVRRAAEERLIKVNGFKQEETLAKIVSLAKDLRAVGEKDLSKKLLVVAGAGEMADISYSSVMRELRQDKDEDRLR